ncbi:MAG TPA: hypothetical protein VK547_06605 [Candidatus Udaeobacter sp.]|nr:hypothetical protein [Candidatus Udaeobacter sp.]
MPTDLDPGQTRETKVAKERQDRQAVKMARHHLYQRMGPGAGLCLDQVRSQVGGGAKDYRSFGMWTRFLVRGWKSYGLPLDVLARALEEKAEQLEASDHVPLYNHVTERQLAVALGLKPAGDDPAGDVTDPEALRLVELLAANLGLSREGDHGFRYLS